MRHVRQQSPYFFKSGNSSSNMSPSLCDLIGTAAKQLHLSYSHRCTYIIWMPSKVWATSNRRRMRPQRQHTTTLERQQQQASKFYQITKQVSMKEQLFCEWQPWYQPLITRSNYSAEKNYGACGGWEGRAGLLTWRRTNCRCHKM